MRAKPEGFARARTGVSFPLRLYGHLNPHRCLSRLFDAEGKSSHAMPEFIRTRAEYALSFEPDWAGNAAVSPPKPVLSSSLFCVSQHALPSLHATSMIPVFIR